jgi:hypothetical protein
VTFGAKDLLMGDEMILDARNDSVHLNRAVRFAIVGSGPIGATLAFACGGIETPRLLLNADSQIPKGLGNAHDLVGRYFMEHPHLPIESLTLLDAGWFGLSIDRVLDKEGRHFMLAFGLPAQIQQQEEILNARAHIFRAPEDEKIARVGIMLEQAPDYENRVALSDRRDCLGMRRIRLNWNLTELDWKTFERTSDHLGREMERLNAGRFVQRDSAPRSARAIGFCNHHIGTTRMSADPRDGVVDSYGRVHSLRNLYIAGSSVFPTGSWANPTFTALAMALRLANHLREKFSTAK